MADLVGTCPKDFWREWIAEGDAAGNPYSGEEWGWYTSHSLKAMARPGDRFYVVAHGRLRGYAPILRVDRGCIVRGGGAVAVTIREPIPGFRGLRMRWWARDEEYPFPNWRDEAPLDAGLFAVEPRP
jgi:hypothetical protein